MSPVMTLMSPHRTSGIPSETALIAVTATHPA